MLLILLEKEKIGISKNGKRLNFFLNHIEKSFNPELIILGGGISKKINLFKDYINIHTTIKSAKLKNNAGIVGLLYLLKIICFNY